MKVAVIGAGPGGMATALVLSREGVEVDVFEAQPHVGGLTRSFDLWGKRVDIGPHLFSGYSQEALALWSAVVGEVEMIERSTRFQSGGASFCYPLQPGDIIRKLGFHDLVACGWSLLRARIRRRPLDGSTHTYVVNLFGERLFDRFFRGYCRKLWGIEAEDVDEEFARIIIQDLSLWTAVRRLIFNRKTAREKVLQSRFPYPRNGAGEFCLGVRRYLESRPGRVQCATPIRRVLVEDGVACGVDPGDGPRRYDHVVSTMPLTHLLRAVGVTEGPLVDACRALRFRNTALVYLSVSSASLFPHLWVYFDDPGILAGRITNYRNWGTSKFAGDLDTTILAVEYWCSNNDEVWRMDDRELTSLAVSECLQLGFVPEGAEFLRSQIHRIHRSHPVYRRGFREHLGPVRHYLAGIRNLHTIGRFGGFHYDAQSHAIGEGMAVAREILASRGARDGPSSPYHAPPTPGGQGSSSTRYG